MLYFTQRAEWRQWLSENHASVKCIWFVFYKKHTGKPSIPYDDAVEEALCFGWIDSIIKKLDEERYIQKFTPRNLKSRWSALNRQRVSSLLENGRMTEAGLKVIPSHELERIQKGDFNDPPEVIDVPEAFARELEKNPEARDNFEKMAPSHKRHYLMWIAAAKTEATLQKRIAESLQLLLKGEKLGMK